MEQISKSEFIRRVTNNQTMFVGISPIGTESEIVLQRLREHAYAPRSCKAMSNQHLVFDNDSHLYLADIKPHTFITCYEDNGVLIVNQEYHDPYDNSITHKYLYYKEV